MRAIVIWPINLHSFSKISANELSISCCKGTLKTLTQTILTNFFEKTPSLSIYNSKGWNLIRNNFFLTLESKYHPKSGFEMQLELILKLRKTNVIFDEIPIDLDYKKKPTKSKMKIFKKKAMLLRYGKRLILAAF